MSTWGCDTDGFWPAILGQRRNATVFVFNYRNHWDGRSSVASMPYPLVAERLMVALLKDCSNFKNILIFTHSFGGIIFKKLCVRMSIADPAYRALLRKFRGLCAFSCPNKGSGWSWIARIPLLHPAYNFRALKKNSPELVELHEKFVSVVRSDMISNLKIQSFGELGYVARCFQIPPVTARFDGLADIAEHLDVSHNHLSICKNIHNDVEMLSTVERYLDRIVMSDGDDVFDILPKL